MPENQPIHVLLVAGRDQVSQWLVSALRAEADIVLVDRVATLERAQEVAGQRKVDVILLDTVVPDAKQLDRLQVLAAAPMSPAVILMVDVSEMTFVQQAILAGVRGFLLKPFTENQLMESLSQASALITQQRQAVGATLTATASRPETAEILVLFSPKGGTGRTSLAANLAIALHNETQKPLTLVDGDLQFGDIDIAVNTMVRASIADLFSYVNELEPSLIESALLDHASGIRLLLAPPYFDPALATDEGRLSHIIKALASAQTGHIIVDAPSGLSEVAMSLFDVAQRVLLVSTLSLASLRATKRFLEFVIKMDVPRDKVMLILNGYRKDADVAVEDIGRHLNWPVTAVVPSDPLAMALAQSQGQPMVVRDRNHAVSKAIIKLAHHLASETADDATEQSGADLAAPSVDKRTTASAMMRLLRPGQVLGT